MFSFGKCLSSSKAYWPTPTRWATLASFPLIPIVIIHILLLSQVRYIAWPENFLWPYLNFNGFTLYKDIFFIYPPLYFWLLASWDKLAGISLLSLQTFSYSIIIVSDFLLYLCAKRKIWPVLIYIPLQIFFEGNGMWPDQLLAPIFLLAYLFLNNKRWLFLGLTLGLALITKQTAAYMVLIFLVASKNRLKIFAGITIPIVFMIIYLFITGAENNFYQQTFVYIFFYHAGNKLQQLWPTVGQIIVLITVFGPPIIIGVLKKRYLLVLLTIFGMLGMFTRFSYFHLQPALPFLALLMGESILNLPIVILVAGLCFKTFGAEPKFLNKQILENAKTINSYILPGSKTLFLTSFDHYYWLTNTIPVGKYFTTSTPWNLAYPGVSKKIIEGLITDRPKFVVIDTRPGEISDFVHQYYQSVLKLTDGTGIFEYNPMSGR